MKQEGEGGSKDGKKGKDKGALEDDQISNASKNSVLSSAIEYTDLLVAKVHLEMKVANSTDPSQEFEIDSTKFRNIRLKQVSRPDQVRGDQLIRPYQELDDEDLNQIEDVQLKETTMQLLAQQAQEYQYYPCKFCQMMSKEPLQCSKCEKAVCKSCSIKPGGDSEDLNQIKCDGAEYVEIHPYFKAKYDKLRFNCRNKGLGCTQNDVELAGLIEHQKKCVFNYYYCPYKCYKSQPDKCRKGYLGL